MVGVHWVGNRRPRGPHLAREVGLALVTAGVVLLLFVLYELVGTNLSEQRSQAQLAQAFNAAVAAAPPSAPATTTGLSGPPVTHGLARPPRSTGKKGARAKHGLKSSGAATVSLPLPPPGGALDHMVIPVIGVNRYVVEGVEELDLQMGPGHYPGTPLPGQDGNVGIAGHRTTFGAPFFRLNELVPGDLIYLTDTSGTTWVYDVVHQWVVPPSDTAVLDVTSQPELTLTTCNPRFEATTRLVVRADLFERLSRSTRLAGSLPQSAPRARASRATTSRRGASAKATSRTTASPAAVPRATLSPFPAVTTSPVAPGTATTLLSHPGGKGAGSAGPDSPIVGPSPAASSGGGGGAWAGAIGWGVLALLGWALTRMVASRRYRYAKVGALVCGGLICLVPLWFAFAHVVDLLPANL